MSTDERKTIAYLHTLSTNEGNRTYRKLTFTRKWPFGDDTYAPGGWSSSTAELVYRGGCADNKSIDEEIQKRLEGLARRWDESANHDKKEDRRAAKRKCAQDLRHLSRALANSEMENNNG